MPARLVLLGLALVLSLPDPAASGLRDGERFDPGTTMAARAEGAPAELDRMTWMLGHWSVAYTRHVREDSSYTASGRADVTFMNRGHSLMERFHCADFDGSGHERNTLSFIVHNEAQRTWGIGIADSWRENIVVYSGERRNDQLVLRHAARLQGGLTLTEMRLVVERRSDDAFTVATLHSTDGEDFEPVVTAAYTRLSDDDGLFTKAAGMGQAAPDLPDQARQFDFLLGEWDFLNDLTLPTGRQTRWTAHGTAVMMMNGHCVMEYTSFDTDPNLPDAATTIVRLWNRQMRRWECMYMTNRFNGILHFGGVMEGDRIVLHKFAADAADVPISQWNFHSWQDQQRYSWYGNTSRDRGATWQKTWIIEATRRPWLPAASAAPAGTMPLRGWMAGWRVFIYLFIPATGCTASASLQEQHLPVFR